MMVGWCRFILNLRIITGLLHIRNLGTSDDASSLLNVVTNLDDPGPIFTCRIPGMVGLSTFKWLRNGSTSFPYERVSQSRGLDLSSQNLEWLHPLDFVDMAKYVCKSNAQGEDTAILTLVVKCKLYDNNVNAL